MEDGNEYVDFDNERPWVHYLYMFGLVDHENKMYTWLVIPKKQETNETPHGYITYTCLGWLTVKTKWCLGWLTVKTKCTHGW